MRPGAPVHHSPVSPVSACMARVVPSGSSLKATPRCSTAATRSSPARSTWAVCTMHAFHRQRLADHACHARQRQVGAWHVERFRA